ncbi:oxidative stress survival, Svf1-like protein [Sphaerosporella brunnea]|uniref:Oxidative stress survival, Svf1-like protein n=1 Tax=Sphaerosporella brunnea TaxID=1250544 RepID=A0A5J5EVQ7_9PEZI|nr:oxidative stress survival, Svf1-like protein [Sphaerosporella brunnea]
MFSWVTNTVQSTLASVAGTAEPIYGPQALHPVSKQEEHNPKYETTPEDFKWQALETTCAETQTFYIEADSGHFVMCQVIYSNVANLHVSAQLNVKVFFPDGRTHWSAVAMNNYAFHESFYSFFADGFSIILSEDHDSFHIKSQLDPETVVDVKIKRTFPGFKVGKDGKTNYGDDPANPWGCIRHIFWPRGVAEGTIEVKGEKVDVAGRALFVMALQGMKPHHAAARWNFIMFASEKVTAIMMEFTTPPSYGTQTVNVGMVLKDGALVGGTTIGTVEHTESKPDPDTEWSEPTALKAVWKGKSQDGKEFEAAMDPTLARIDRVDIMAEVPAIIKKFVAGAVGTRPYIYQYRQEATLKLKVGEEVIEEKGTMFMEATFIS